MEEHRHLLTSFSGQCCQKNVDKITIKTHGKMPRNLTKSLSLSFTTEETVHKLLAKLWSINWWIGSIKVWIRHPIYSLQIKKTDILTTLDFIPRAVANDLKDRKYLDELKTKMSHLANTYVNVYKPIKNYLKKYKIFKKLRIVSKIHLNTIETG